jgi:hypothetical protein
VAQPTNWSPLGFEAQTKKPSWWFWGINHQTKAADFEAQIGKLSTTLVLRLNEETDCRFWGQTGRNRRHQFWGQTGEIHRSRFWGQTVRNHHNRFWGQTAKNVTTGFEAKLPETVTTGFEAKPMKTVRVVLRPNHSQTVAIGFEAQTDEKPSQWFWGQTTDKPSTLVLRLNQETRAPRLHVHGADRTRCHSTSRSPDHRVPDLCDHPRSSAPGLLLLPLSSSLHAMPHLPPAHHETIQHDSPNETKIKEKQNETVPNSNSNIAKSMSHHNQTKELTTWFLNLPLDESIDNKSTKFEVQIQDPMKHR